MKTWLKGGLIGGVAYFLISIFSIIITSGQREVMWLFFILFPSLWFLDNLIFIVILNAVFYFLVGALVGFVVGKIKGKKNEGVA